MHNGGEIDNELRQVADTPPADTDSKAKFRHPYLCISLLFVLALLWVLLSLAHVTFTFSFPILFLPLAIVNLTLTPESREHSLEDLFIAFCSAFFSIPILVISIFVAAFMPLHWVLQDTSVVIESLVLIFTLVTFAEYAKFIILRRGSIHGVLPSGVDPYPLIRNNVFRAFGIALGFSAGKGTFFLIIATIAAGDHDISAAVIIAAIMFCIILAPSQILFGYLMGIQFGAHAVFQHPLRYHRVLGLPILLNTLYFWQPFVWGTVAEQQAPILVLFTALLLLSTALFLVKRYEKSLPTPYISKISIDKMFTRNNRCPVDHEGISLDIAPGMGENNSGDTAGTSSTN